MSYKTVMVRLRLGEPNTALVQFVAGFAKRHAARVVGIAAAQPIQLVDVEGCMPGELIQTDREEIEEEVRVAKAEFYGALQSSGLALEWRSSITLLRLAEYFARQARCADLVIAVAEHAGEWGNPTRHLGYGDLVMQLGRPILIVPLEAPQSPLTTALIGWKDSREARRAIADALPLLKTMEKVYVGTVVPKEDAEKEPSGLSDVISWLKAHEIAAEPRVAFASGDDVEDLNRLADESHADLIVAGAYGHSRLREWVFGGVTHDVLMRPRRSTLLSH
ncbi:MAG: universal stress protein [Burkholderiaceae bacterium]